ncbi:CBS domain-containing protein [Mesorhizobium sp. Mes31]|uniref:CBS domain-containing protein n=1 Tax=Mesorhizobium sp. Mes31 TaxID=2926017 RepID=UPI0021178383|nr:CBS domain-containing protein [Mesorhizobium sp. Mes31]
MSDSVVTTAREASFVEAVELMARHNVKRLPVVEDGKVAGIIARSDLLRALLRVLPMQGSTDVGDEQIRQNTLAELESQTWARNSLIHVNVDKGVAELSGPIFDERKRQAALVAAASNRSRRWKLASLPATSAASALLKNAMPWLVWK